MIPDKKNVCIFFSYIKYIPGTCLSCILEVEPSKTRPFSSKTRVIWVPGHYILLNKFVPKASSFWEKNMT